MNCCFEKLCRLFSDGCYRTAAQRNKAMVSFIFYLIMRVLGETSKIIWIELEQVVKSVSHINFCQRFCTIKNEYE